MSAAWQQQLQAALVALRTGRPADAERLLQDFLKREPRHVGALNLLAVALMSVRRFAEAEPVVARAVSLDRRSDAAFRNYGIILKKLGKAKAALKQFDRAIALNATAPETWNDRGAVLNQLNEYDRAIGDFDKALSLDRNYADAWYNKAKSLGELGRDDDALAAYDRVLVLKPDLAEAWSARGSLLFDLNRDAEALSSLDKAIGITADLPEPRFVKSLVKLSRGEYREGWELYEWRWKVGLFTSPNRNFRKPLWRGESRRDYKTILIHAEQGLGDTIQFYRYLSRPKESDPQIIFETQEELLPLFKAQSAGIDLVGRGDPLPPFEAHCPLMSLPFVCKTTLDTIPAWIPYLKPPKDKIAEWRIRLGEKRTPRVGLAWSGHASLRHDNRRSVPLENLLPIVTAAADWHSLQKDVRAQDRICLARTPVIKHYGELLRDFSDTAALIEEMDLVISVDTAVAHLAGALGKPVWILLPFHPDFRWLRERADSPWYPSARLFRQGEAGDWRGVIARMAAELTSALVQ